MGVGVNRGASGPGGGAGSPSPFIPASPGATSSSSAWGGHHPAPAATVSAHLWGAGTGGSLPPPPHHPPCPHTPATLSMKELVDAKERELREIHEYRIAALERVLGERETTIADLSAKLSKLREDFRYNLGLIEGRDAELDRYEATLEGVRACLRDKEAENSELSKHVDELLSRAAEAERHDSEAVEHWRAKCKELRAEAEGLRWSHENALREVREAADSAKTYLSRQLMTAEEEADSVRREMAASFDDVMRQREEEARKKEAEWVTKLGEAEAKAAEASRVADRASYETSQLRDELSRAQEALAASSRELRAAKWKSEDVVEARAAEIRALEQERDRARQDAQDAAKAQEGRISEVLSSLHALEQAFVRQKEDAALAADGWEVRERALQAEVEELRAEVRQGELNEANLSRQLRAAHNASEKQLSEMNIASKEMCARKDRELDALRKRLAAAEEELGEQRAELEERQRVLESHRLESVTTAGELEGAGEALRRATSAKDAMAAQLQAALSAQELTTKELQDLQARSKCALDDVVREKEELEFRVRELESQVAGGGLIGAGMSPIFSDDMGPASPVPGLASGSRTFAFGNAVDGVREAAEEALRQENQRLRDVVADMRHEVEALRQGESSVADPEGEDLRARLRDAADCSARSEKSLQDARSQLEILAQEKLQLERRCRELEVNLIASRKERDRLMELSNSLRSDLHRAVASSEDGAPGAAEAISLARRETRAKYKAKIAQIETAFRSLLEENSQLKEDMRILCDEDESSSAPLRPSQDGSPALMYMAGVAGGSVSSAVTHSTHAGAHDSSSTSTMRELDPEVAKRARARRRSTRVIPAGGPEVLMRQDPAPAEAAAGDLEEDSSRGDDLGVTGFPAALPKRTVSSRSSDRTTESQKAAQQRLKAASERRRSSTTSFYEAHEERIMSGVANYNQLRGAAAAARPSISEPSESYR
jgi:hypothetical protein